MSEQACNYLDEQIERAIDYCRQEYQISYAEVIGVLQVKVIQISQEAMDYADDEDQP